MADQRKDALEALGFARTIRRTHAHHLVGSQQVSEPEKVRLFRGYELLEKVLLRAVTAAGFESETTPSENPSRPRTSEEMSTTEAAKRLDVSPQCVTEWCRSGEVKARREGRYWRVDRESVEALAEQRGRMNDRDRGDNEGALSGVLG